MMLALILAVPLFALPAHGAPAHGAGHKPVHYRAADFADARAHVSPVTSVARTLDADGLSRKDDECNMGCIDH
jgi:hypothetical protein